MNFTQINDVGNFINKHLKYLHNHITCKSMDDYLNEIHFLKKFAWLKECHTVMRSHALYKTEDFLKRFEKKCVSVYSPRTPEDGILKIIYQISPTIHLEASLFAWFEVNEVYSYIYFVAMFNNINEYIELLDSIKDIQQFGQTGENKLGFSNRLM